jgi:hypothetical protein
MFPRPMLTHWHSPCAPLLKQQATDVSHWIRNGSHPQVPTLAQMKDTQWAEINNTRIATQQIKGPPLLHILVSKGPLNLGDIM